MIACYVTFVFVCWGILFRLLAPPTCLGIVELRRRSTRGGVDESQRHIAFAPILLVHCHWTFFILFHAALLPGSRKAAATSHPLITISSVPGT